MKYKDYFLKFERGRMAHFFHKDGEDYIDGEDLEGNKIELTDTEKTIAVAYFYQIEVSESNGEDRGFTFTLDRKVDEIYKKPKVKGFEMPENLHHLEFSKRMHKILNEEYGKA